LLDKASEAKLPGSSESDVFQYNNSTCAVDLIDKDKSGNENENGSEKWKMKMKNEALVARLVLIVLYFLYLGFSVLIVLWMMKYD
jgi:hypothetical protein